jgi:outer membrane protein assembly factor BamE (lipoprotein component of BamABCDE complex)
MPRIAKVFLICLLLLAAVLVFPSARYGYDMSDTFACLLTTGQHATRFATGYTDRAFSGIRQGMTTNEVLRILGEPLNRATWSSWPEGEWQYSQPASSSGHYHLRTVRFSGDGRVSAAHKLFYFD